MFALNVRAVFRFNVVSHKWKIIMFFKTIDYDRSEKLIARSLARICERHCKVISPTTSFIRATSEDPMTSLRSTMTDVGKDHHRLVFLRGSGSPASPFFLSSAFLRRARQLRITYQLIAFFNIRDKRLKLPYP